MAVNFVLFCKTYRNDLPRFRNLLESCRRYNRDAIPFIISVPSEDLQLFREFEGSGVTLIADESYGAGHMVPTNGRGFSAGYWNQEILKLCFWEAGMAENYLCMDSDALFIRDFFVRDFMVDAKTPYSVLVMDKDLCAERHYHESWDTRSVLIKKIFDTVGLDDPRQKTCHNMQVLSSRVLASFKESFMRPKGFAYTDLLEIAPFEFSWYNAWLQKAKPIDIVEVEPFFKMFHMRIEYLFARLRLIRKEDWARSYVGIVLNSNWRNKPSLVYEAPGFFERHFYRWLKKR